MEEQAILRSWAINASAWTKAIAGGSVESRKLVTDAAILDAVMDCVAGRRGDTGTPASTFAATPVLRLLDIGCGEGWLARALAAQGFAVSGIDAVDTLIAAARASGCGRFDVCTYEDFAAKKYPFGDFDVAVCNFSLLGNASVESALSAVPGYMSANGRLVVQTLHPLAACGDLPYVDGWRAGSWRGFDPAFRDPAPWYFRTLESWFELLRAARFELLECREPKASIELSPASVIFISKLRTGE